MRCQPIGFAVALLLPLASCQEAVVVGSKDFSESILLGEILAQHLEHAGFSVKRRLNYGNSKKCHEALQAGVIDLYVEYTGTAYADRLGMSGERDPDRVYALVDSVYRDRWGLEWMGRFGFNDTFVILIRGEDARRWKIKSLSEAREPASSWNFAAGEEFWKRPDGYHGLVEAYGLRFKDGDTLQIDSTYMALALRGIDITQVDPTHRGLARKGVDVIVGNSTDGWIGPLWLVPLEDDRHFFPAYEAAPVVRIEALDRHRGLREAVNALAGAIDEEDMRRLNSLVGLELRSVEDVACDFLRTRGHVPECP